LTGTPSDQDCLTKKLGTLHQVRVLTPAGGTRNCDFPLVAAHFPMVVAHFPLIALTSP
jgi:hypothetical protein